jgi:hypothetical protein
MTRSVEIRSAMLRDVGAGRKCLKRFGLIHVIRLCLGGASGLQEIFQLTVVMANLFE